MSDLIQSSEVVRRDADAVIPTPTRAGGRTGDFHGENLQCRQWQKRLQNDNPSVSAICFSYIHCTINHYFCMNFVDRLASSKMADENWRIRKQLKCKINTFDSQSMYTLWLELAWNDFRYSYIEINWKNPIISVCGPTIKLLSKATNFCCASVAWSSMGCNKTLSAESSIKSQT